MMNHQVTDARARGPGRYLEDVGFMGVSPKQETHLAEMDGSVDSM
jgi:hypothetical protein